jgi:hypothetical protein
MADPLISETRTQPVYAQQDEMFALKLIRGQTRTKTLSGALTLDATYPDTVLLTLDAARAVTLDVIASSSGLRRYIGNATTAASYLMTVANPAAATIGLVRPGEVGVFYNDGTAWNLEYVFPMVASSGAAVTATAITSATILTRADSGRIFTVSQAAAYDIDLPSPVMGAGDRYLFQLVAPGANNVTLTVAGSAATFEGSITIDAATIVATGSTLTFASGASLLGDSIEAISTATGKYFIRAFASGAGGITVA